MVFAFSPHDGRYLASQDRPSRTVVVWDLDQDACVRPGPGQQHGSWIFSPDGRSDRRFQVDGSLLVYDLKSGQCCSRWSRPAASRSDLAFRPDDGQIAVVYWENQPTCRIRDADTGKQVRAISIPSADTSRGARRRNLRMRRRRPENHYLERRNRRPRSNMNYPDISMQTAAGRAGNALAATAMKDGSGSGTRSWAARS